QHTQQSGIDGTADYEKRPPVHRVNPVIGRAAQTEPLTGNITPRQIGEFSMINPHMTIGVKDAGTFGFLRHPLLGQSVAPAFSASREKALGPEHPKLATAL